MQSLDDFEELRVCLERIRTLLENLVVRGLRACGPDELTQMTSYAEQLQHSGAGHLAATITELRDEVERDQRSSARTLLLAQTNVRLVERLLTLRVVGRHFADAIIALEQGETVPAIDGEDELDED